MKHKAISEVLGSNAALVLSRIKRAVSVEPVFKSACGNHPSNEWVEWYMEQMGCDRRIALNRAYALFDAKEREERDDTSLEIDEGLRMLGTVRLKDYFATTGAALRQQLRLIKRLKEG